MNELELHAKLDKIHKELISVKTLIIAIWVLTIVGFGILIGK